MVGSTSRIANGVRLSGTEGLNHFKTHPVLRRLLSTNASASLDSIQDSRWLNSLGGFLLARINRAELVETDLVTPQKLGLDQTDDRGQVEALASELSWDVGVSERGELRIFTSAELLPKAAANGSILNIAAEVSAYYALPVEDLSVVITVFINREKFAYARKLLFATPSDINAMRDPISLVNLAYQIEPKNLAKLLINMGTADAIRLFFKRFAVLGKNQIDLRWIAELIHALDETIADRVIEEFVNTDDNCRAVLENIIELLRSFDQNQDIELYSFFGDKLYNSGLNFLAASQKSICKIYDGAMAPRFLLAKSLVEEVAPVLIEERPTAIVLPRPSQLVLDGLQGERLWSKELSFALKNCLKIAGGSLYAMSDQRTLFCIDTGGGEIGWTKSLDGYLRAGTSPVITESFFAYIDSRNVFNIIDLENRNSRSTCKIGGINTGRSGAPAYVNGFFYCSGNYQVVKIGPDGKMKASIKIKDPPGWKKWRRAFSKNADKKGVLVTHPILVGDELFVVAKEGKTGARYSIGPWSDEVRLVEEIDRNVENINLYQGNSLLFLDCGGPEEYKWPRKSIYVYSPNGVVASVLAYESRLILNGRIYDNARVSPYTLNSPKQDVFVRAFNARGEELWRRDVDQSPFDEYADLCYHQGHLFVEVGIMERRLAILDADSGEPSGYIPLKAPLFGAPFSSGENLFFQTQDKKLHAYRIVKES
ncbi:MAG: PQQ-binding-like beta-propeller repeat protein [Candidatus Saganbacteria bacterium]|nr:PQQ-binding-like beta-propeller repeat protein [Candidatus Saganbacteria bacterium]